MPRDNGYVKVFCNSIGWVKSAKSVADYNRVPKVLINSAELLTYSQRRYGQILMIFLQSCKMRIVSHGDENNFLPNLWYYKKTCVMLKFSSNLKSYFRFI